MDADERRLLRILREFVGAHRMCPFVFICENLLPNLMEMNVFEEAALEYDEWFENYEWVYQSEVEAVKRLIPQTGEGLEIGVGTGRFSIPFGIKVGIEPAHAMAEIARERGIHVCLAKAENLPFRDSSFDFALMVTTLCFLENPLQALTEIRRLLKPTGKIVIGMLDKDSPLGRLYEEKRKESKFYRDARFYSAKQVLDWLKKLEFINLQTVQTIFKNPDEIKSLESVEEGFGKGLFIVISAENKKAGSHIKV